MGSMRSTHSTRNRGGVARGDIRLPKLNGVDVSGIWRVENSSRVSEMGSSLMGIERRVQRPKGLGYEVWRTRDIIRRVISPLA